MASNSQARGLSIHIGLNHVNPTAYGGWDGALSGCINDATDMKLMADGLGYQSALLTDSQATSDAVAQQIGMAAQQLQSGDVLLLTYSGHGGQVEDVNGDEGGDGLDETWVLWDRQLVDDELYALWSQFAAGVRIVVLSDSCHSGTVLRMMAAFDVLTKQRPKDPAADKARQAAISGLASVLGIAVEAPTRGARGKGRAQEAVASVALPSGKSRVMPADIQAVVNASRSAQLAAAQFVAGSKEQAEVDASVILISGCQDSQLSMDGARNGLFTEKLKQVWNDGRFSGDYRRFHADIVARMPSNQTPNFATAGSPNPGFEAQTPFAISSGGLIAITPGSSSSRPTLYPGSSGPSVVYLQERLNAFGYPLPMDGQFGSLTHGAVFSFQATHGLTVDGIVGPGTWAALEQGGAVAPPASSPQGGASPTPAGQRPTLQNGSTGPDVVYLQQRLISFGYAKVQADGKFGYATESAVRAFQASNGLSADGVVGPDTWQALDADRDLRLAG